jgi:hypothetical protein
VLQGEREKRRESAHPQVGWSREKFKRGERVYCKKKKKRETVKRRKNKKSNMLTVLIDKNKKEGEN